MTGKIVIKQKFGKRQGNKGLGKAQAKAVRRIAKRVCQRAEETKCRFVSTQPYLLHGGEIACINPLYWIPTDGSQSGRIGDKIMNPHLTIRGLYKHKGSNRTLGGLGTNAEAYLWSSSWLRVVVFQLGREWHNTNENGFSPLFAGVPAGVMTVPDILRGNVRGRFAHTFLNTDTIKVISDKRYKCSFHDGHSSTNNAADVTTGNHGAMTAFSQRVKLPKSIQFNQSNVNGVSYYRGPQIYVAVMVGTGVNDDYGDPVNYDDPNYSSEIGTVQIDYIVTWKDA